MADVIKINESFNEQKNKIAAKVAKKSEKGQIKDSLVGKTFAELGQEKKNQISHRAIALKKAKNLLRTYMEDLKMDVMTAIKTRRSIRAYKDKPIEDEKLKAVLEAGRLAPSARNLQEWKYVVVKDKGLRDKLIDAANGQRFVGQAPAVIVACAVQTDHVMPCGELSSP